MRWCPAWSRDRSTRGVLHGTFDPTAGLRHDMSALLLDPYGVAVTVPTGYDRLAGTRPGRDPRTAMKSVVADLSVYDWEGDLPLGRPFARTVIYELHVRGFTAHPTSGVDGHLAGTYAGLVTKIPYLRSLGITAVELMPVQAFDPQDAPPGLVNYWGYSPVSFFAPHAAYASTREPLGALDEFRTMVKELHRAGIEVILDVVFNHTAEGERDGPHLLLPWARQPGLLHARRRRTRRRTWTTRGMREHPEREPPGGAPGDRRLRCDHWVDRDARGRLPFRSRLGPWPGIPRARRWPTRPSSGRSRVDPVLAGTKLIAEAWDVAGLYQVGSFVGDRWREWNGKFRDDIRRFVRGDGGTVGLLPNRLLGSPDLFGGRAAEVEHSINFITCHDGFTLNDLVSYTGKHNEANRADNQDGTDDNYVDRLRCRRAFR